MGRNKATFNPNATNLFSQTNEHLRKEMVRRGIGHLFSTNKAENAAKIIWKDAYDAGVNDSRHNTANCSISAPMPKEPETQDYLLANDYHDKRYHISLTAEQKAFWDWLNGHNFIDSEAYLENWGDDVIEVGRIK